MQILRDLPMLKRTAFPLLLMITFLTVMSVLVGVPNVFAGSHALSVRESNAAGITVAAAVANADELRAGDAESIEFEIGLDTHFGDLFQFQIDELAEIVVNGERQLEGAFEWVGGQETSHHRNGRLVLTPDNPDALGQWLTEEVKIELRLNEIGTEVRTFRWEL